MAMGTPRDGEKLIIRPQDTQKQQTIWPSSMTPSVFSYWPIYPTTSQSSQVG